MKKFLFGCLTVVALLAIALVGFSFSVSTPLFQEQRGDFEPLVADKTDALTFARSGDKLILVGAHKGDYLTGVDLTRLYGVDQTKDLLQFLANIDLATLETLETSSEDFPLTDLTQPLSYTYPAVAAGTNFKKHAEEVYLDDPPFLFPKLVKPDSWQTTVPFVSRLDFEAELCMFPLKDINSPESETPFGLVLCNDFTDRWTLVMNLDLGRPMGQTGFAEGKGCERCLPTGYLVVIPKSPEFYLSLELSLFVNDELRQRFHMSDVILPIEGIVKQAFANKKTEYQKGEEVISLLPSGEIPRGTLLLTGTAGGVIFKPANIWNQGFYLQAGDVVRTESTYLGHLENTIEEQ